MRIGILGFGGAGRAHYSYFSCVPGCRVTKVFDVAEQGLARARQLIPEVTATCELATFWDGLDAVSVCTPDDTHADYIVAALAHDLPVLCEKPLTDSLDGIRRIWTAAERSSAVVAVLHQMRFVPLNRTIKGLLEQARLGTVSYLEGYYVHDLRHRAFLYDDWRRSGHATPLVYAGCHFVDLLRWFAAEPVVEVYAAGNHLAFPEYPEADLTVATLRFASGVVGKVMVAIGAAGPQDHSVRLYGSRASIENNVLFTAEEGWHTIARPRLVHRPLLADPNPANGHGLLAQLRSHLPAALLGRAFEVGRWLARRPGAEYGARFYPLRLYEHALACVGAVEDFVAAVERSGEPLCTVEESARTVLACLAGVESSHANKPVAVPILEQVV